MGGVQPWVLGSLSFTIYINDLDSRVKNRLSKFADDTKVGDNIESREEGMGGCHDIQGSFDTFINWAEDWQMQFNMKTYKVLRI